MKTDRYENKVALVTGGTSGIGKATAIGFAEAGAKVVLTGRRQKEGSDVVAQIEKLGGTASFFKADFSQEAEVQAAIDFTVKIYGRLDVAFNNAGLHARMLEELPGGSVAVDPDCFRSGCVTSPRTLRIPVERRQ